MLDAPRNPLGDVRGLGRLAVEATRAVTDATQAMHGAIGGAPARLFSAPEYASIRGITALVGVALDAGLGALTPLAAEGTPGPERAATLAALNGVLGDYLAATGNPLAIGMRLHRPAAATASPNVVVFVHGSSMSHHAWSAAPDLGWDPLYVDYNSGLHVSINGRALAAQLEEALAAWPVPVESVAIVAHSMGGLVARSACHYAEAARLAWREKLRVIVFLGTPHLGASLEQGGNWVETLLGVTRYSAPLARLARVRSAGVTDLRFGHVVDEDWQGRDRFALGRRARAPLPLPAGVACHAIAAEHDRLVPRASALGAHADPAHGLAFAEDRRAVVPGVGHLELLRSPAAWSEVARRLAPATGRAADAAIGA